MNKNKGFTILELIISVAIIALLASAVLFTIDGVKAKSRDAKRISDVKELTKSLHLYNNDAGSFVPTTGGNPVTITGTDEVSTSLENGGYITDSPSDPAEGYSYIYQPTNSNLSFTITFCQETDSIQGLTQGCTNVITP